MPKGFFAKKIALVCMIFSSMMLFGGLMSGSRELPVASATIFAGALVAFAIGEQNPNNDE